MNDFDKNEGVAVIGMSCRFPGATNMTELYTLLCSNKNVIKTPENRWQKQTFLDHDLIDPGTSYSESIGAIDNVYSFDNVFFDISSREARNMDPQQRLVLELTYEAFENTGMPLHTLSGSATGVFLGLGNNDYETRFLQNFSQMNAHYLTGNLLCTTANRISHFFNLQGPAMVIDTGCSSALVAIHQAIYSLLSKEINLAVVGGVNLILSPKILIGLAQTWILSPTGTCKSFDANADGYVRSEGGGIFVLKRLRDAIADNDNILCVIRGTATNQNGAGEDLTTPNPVALKNVMEQALKKSAISAETVDFIEAHGVATPVSDTNELDALQQVYNNVPLYIGSIKSNIGHLEWASGCAELAKIILMMQYKKIFPNHHFNTPHPKLVGSNLRISTKVIPWEKVQPSHKCYTSAINSFGIGGTNVHMIVQSWEKEQTKSNFNCSLFLLTAKTEKALHDLAQKYLDYLAQEEMPIANLCINTILGRNHFALRKAFIANSQQELYDSIHHFVAANQTSKQNAYENPSATKQVFIKLPDFNLNHNETTTFSSDVFQSYYDNAPDNKFIYATIATLKDIGVVVSGIVSSNKSLYQNIMNNITHLEFVEQAPQDVLCLPINHTWLSFEQALASLYIENFAINWEKLYSGIAYEKMLLPNYPFQREYFEVQSSITQQESTKSDESKLFVDKLVSVTSNQQIRIMEDTIVAYIADILECAGESISFDLGFQAMGFSSIMAIDLQNRLQNILQKKFPATAMFEYPNIHALARYLIGTFFNAKSTATSNTIPTGEGHTKDTTLAKIEKDIDELSDEEAENALREILEADNRRVRKS